MAIVHFLVFMPSLYGCDLSSFNEVRRPTILKFRGADFIVHITEYSILGLLLSWGLAASGVKRRLFLYVVAIGVLYGIVDEIHQYFVPRRSASILDVIADSLGSMIGACLFCLLHSTRNELGLPYRHRLKISSE
jgi:VanZ family protein